MRHTASDLRHAPRAASVSTFLPSLCLLPASLCGLSSNKLVRTQISRELRAGRCSTRLIAPPLFLTAHF